MEIDSLNVDIVTVFDLVLAEGKLSFIGGSQRPLVGTSRRNFAVVDPASDVLETGDISGRAKRRPRYNRQPRSGNS